MRNCQQVRSHECVDEEAFRRIVDESQPVILKNCDFGDCITKWNLDYLNEKLSDQEIVIHVSNSARLEFIEKNFRYLTCKFKELVERLLKKGPGTESIYLRSTHSNPRAKRPARIENDFPDLSDDLKPPSFIPFGANNELYHSSVLRIASANVQVWTHFDIYDNVLYQVAGSKRVILFAPKDSRYLYVEGDKSRINDFESGCYEAWPLLCHAEPWLCDLKPGDCLFIPKMWWHNIKNLDQSRTGGETDPTPGYSIGFNIFWRNQELVTRSLYADGDVYGNKHLKPYEAALSNVDRAMKHLDSIPGDSKYLYQVLLLKHMMKKMNIDFISSDKPLSEHKT